MNFSKLLYGVCLGALATLGLADKIRYDGYSIVRLEFSPLNSTQVDVVRSLPSHFAGLNLHSTRDVMIHSSKLPSLYVHLSDYDIKPTILHTDYQELIDRVDAMQNAARLRSDVARASNLLNSAESVANDFFSAYRTNDEIHTYFLTLASQFPDVVTVQNIGQTYEKNDQYAYTVTANNGVQNKPTIVLEGGIHAREWIAHSTVTYMASSLITTNSTLLESAIFVFIPIVNVDGYLYTWSTDRNWRKTRTPTALSPLCVGADPNRNWDSHWCEDGASTNPCDESYCGKAAFSEPCVKNVADFILTLSNVKAFIDFHSYSQLWMRPYGYTASLPKNSAQQKTVGQSAVKAISGSSGLTYEEGSIYTIIYPASGSSADWGYDTVGIPFPYGVELRDTGTYGFILPPDQIIPCGEEILAAVTVMTQYVIDHPEAVALPENKATASKLFKINA